jgi:hypothetical protein
MKRWSIAFPGECGQDVVETWTEDQIIDSYYKYWATKMIETGQQANISRESCIKDWCVVHWAWEAKDERTNGKLDV